MKLTFVPPRLTLRQKVATSTLCTSASALYIIPSVYAGFADVGAQMLVGGLFGPPAVAAVYWMAKSWSDDNDVRKLAERQEAEDAAARLAEQRRVVRRPSPRRLATTVIEGEVVSR